MTLSEDRQRLEDQVAAMIEEDRQRASARARQPDPTRVQPWSWVPKLTADDLAANAELNAADNRARDEAARDERLRSWTARADWEFRDATVDSLDTSEKRRIAADYTAEVLAGPCGNLLLGGPKGTGKTRVAYTILRSAHLAGESWAFAPVKNLLDQVRASHDDPGELARFTQPTLLVLEFDEQREFRTDWQAQVLFDVISTRRRRGRPIIVTTNLELAVTRDRDGRPVPGHYGLDQVLTEATYDRLIDGALGYEIRGESRRRPRPRLEVVR
jgi:DNA replication protein DnaC